MYKVIHRGADPYRHRHQEAKGTFVKSCTKVSPHTDTGVEKTEAAYIIHASVDPHRYRHQKAEAACARSYMRVLNLTDTGIKKTDAACAMSYTRVHASAARSYTGIKKLKLHVQGHTCE
jgi:hypothetical protein